MIEKILLLGDTKIQYYMAKSLSQRGFAIFYYGEMYWERPIGVKRIHTKQQLESLLFDDTCMMVLPIERLYKWKNDTLEKLWNATNKTLVSCQVCDLRREGGLLKQLAPLWVQGVLIEAMLLAERGIFEANVYVFGDSLFSRILKDYIRSWHGKVNEDKAATMKELDYVFLCEAKGKIRPEVKSKITPETIVLNLSTDDGILEKNGISKYDSCVKNKYYILSEYTPRQTADISVAYIEEKIK